MRWQIQIPQRIDWSTPLTKLCSRLLRTRNLGSHLQRIDCSRVAVLYVIMTKRFMFEDHRKAEPGRRGWIGPDTEWSQLPLRLRPHWVDHARIVRYRLSSVGRNAHCVVLRGIRWVSRTDVLSNVGQDSGFIGPYKIARATDVVRAAKIQGVIECVPSQVGQNHRQMGLWAGQRINANQNCWEKTVRNLVV